jgi:hypothetical protein
MEKSVTEGIFPGMAGLFSPVGTEQVQRLQVAGQPVDPLQAVSGSMGFLGERMQQGIGSAFGQMPQQDRKRQVFQQLVQQLSQQGVDISTADGMVQLAQKLSSLPGFEGEALGLRQRAAQMAQQQRMTGLEESKAIADINLKKAQEEKALREKAPKLSERLVELETKKSTEGLTPQESAELTALQKVVKLQSPKGVDLSGLASVLGEKATEEEAKALGKDLGTIQGKQQSVESLRSARKILDQGIYSGSYAEFQSELAKKTLGGVGNLKRVENTEVFINEVSSNVIPLLQEFGGNDSNEELRFLQRLVGGDITLQESSIRRILDNAIKKIERGIQRTAAKGQAVREGKMPELPQPAKPSQTRTTKSGVTYEIIED